MHLCNLLRSIWFISLLSMMVLLGSCSGTSFLQRRYTSGSYIPSGISEPGITIRTVEHERPALTSPKEAISTNSVINTSVSNPIHADSDEGSNPAVFNRRAVSSKRQYVAHILSSELTGQSVSPAKKEKLQEGPSNWDTNPEKNATVAIICSFTGLALLVMGSFLPFMLIGLMGLFMGFAFGKSAVKSARLQGLPPPLQARIAMAISISVLVLGLLGITFIFWYISTQPIMLNMGGAIFSGII
jgi:hypothetical protein